MPFHTPTFSSALVEIWPASQLSKGMADRWSSYGGFWIRPRQREVRVVDHHAAVVAAPDLYGLSSHELVAIGRSDRRAVLTAVIGRGWIRVRRPVTGESDLDAVHVDLWELSTRNRRRIASWFRRYQVSSDTELLVGCLRDGTKIRMTGQVLVAGLYARDHRPLTKHAHRRTRGP